MVARENKVAQLDIFRPVRFDDPKILTTIRTIAAHSFGEVDFARATLRPPLVEEEVVVPAGDPRANVLNMRDLRLKLLSRVSTDDRAGKKVSLAQEKLEHGVLTKNPQGRNVPGKYSVLPLVDRLTEAEVARRAELTKNSETDPADVLLQEAIEVLTGPEAELKLAFNGLFMARNPLVTGEDIYFLVPDFCTDVYAELKTEQAVSELSLSQVSKPVAAMQNPQPFLLVPFMYIDSDTSEKQRRNFIEQTVVPGVFPIDITLGPVDIKTSS